MPAPAWLILPTYDEAENIEPLVREVRAVLTAAVSEGFRILIVDDASPDGTGAIAGRLAERHEEVEVLHRPHKAGLASAYIAGFDRALSDGAGLVLQMDSDFSHAPSDLPRLIAAARGGADVVLGSRYVAGGGVENWRPLRRWVSRAGCRYAREVLGLPVRDLTGGFKCFRADALRRLDPRSVRSRGYAFQVEMTWRAMRAGLSVAEVPIVFRERREGRSKMTRRIAVEAAGRVPLLRLRASRAGRLGRLNASKGVTPASVTILCEASHTERSSSTWRTSPPLPTATSRPK